MARDGGPDACVTPEEAVVDRLAHESSGLVAAEVTAVEKLAQS